MDETMNEINHMATERHNLYRKAAKAALNADQKQRMAHINAQLPLMWDRHRRELAARVHARKPRSLYDFAA